MIFKHVNDNESSVLNLSCSVLQFALSCSRYCSLYDGHSLSFSATESSFVFHVGDMGKKPRVQKAKDHR